MPGLVRGVYFRSLLIGYFDGINSERGIALRLANSLALWQFPLPAATQWEIV